MSAANRKWKDVLRERAYEIYPYRTLEQLCEASHDPEANLALYRIMVNGGEMFTPTMLAAYFPIRLTRLQHIYRTRGRGTKYS
jgi:hypothetical protein